MSLAQKRKRIDVPTGTERLAELFDRRLDEIQLVYESTVDVDYVVLCRRLSEFVRVDGADASDIRRMIAGYYRIRRDKTFADRFIDIYRASRNNAESTTTLSFPDAVDLDAIANVFNDAQRRLSDESGYYEFSFTSKLLNLIDRRFPIYDSNVDTTLKRLKILRLSSYPNNSLMYAEWTTLTNVVLRQCNKRLQDLRDRVFPRRFAGNISLSKVLDTALFSLARFEKNSGRWIQNVFGATDPRE